MPTNPPPDPTLTDEELASRFHEAYERLAPDYGYRTRPESQGSWEKLSPTMRALMCATVAEAIAPLETQLHEARDAHAEFAAEYNRVVKHRDEAQAQVAALRAWIDEHEVIHASECALVSAAIRNVPGACDCGLEDALTNTTATARAFEERIRGEEREAAAKRIAELRDGFYKNARPDLLAALDGAEKCTRRRVGEKGEA